MNAQNIKEIETWYRENAATIPDQIQLNPHTKINDTKKFIESHLTVCNAQKENKTFEPYYNRLIELKTKLCSL